MESPLRPDAGAEFCLIETCRYEPGRGIHDLNRHVQRIGRSALALGMYCDRAAAEDLLTSVQGDTPQRCRLTLDQAGQLDLTCADFSPESRCWTVAISDTRLESSDPWLRHKTSNRTLYDQVRRALPKGIDEVLFLNERDELCEGTITNVFLRFEDGPWLTPPVASGCLPGVFRQRMLESGKAVEQRLTWDDLQNARAIMLGNSLRGAIEAERQS